ncbi:MAB_1171c family putative transporter [Streptomyces chattanoogensis]
MLAWKSVIFPVCSVICVLSFFYKLLDLRRRKGDPALSALLVAFFCKGVSFALSTPEVSARVDAFFGVPNLGALGIHVMGGVLSSAALLITIVYWVYPAEQAIPKMRVRLLGAALCGALMVTLWWTGNDGSGGRTPHYLLQNAHHPITASYLLVYVAAFGASMIEIIRLCRRYGRVSGRTWLRRGLSFTAIGATACLVYCLNRASVVVAVQLNVSPLNWEALTPIANGIGITFLAAGLTMPSWGPSLSGVRRRMTNFMAYRHMHRLWSDLCAANPSIALSPQETSALSRCIPYDINYRLYRRVIEIQDGLLALRPYMDPTGADTGPPSHGQVRLSGMQGVTAEAALIVAALEAKVRNVQPSQEPMSVTSFVPSDVDYAGEVCRLVGIARAYAAFVQQGSGGRQEGRRTGAVAMRR